jgi:hypothetical protein
MPPWRKTRAARRRVLAHVERLHYVVVRARLEAGHALELAAARRREDDGDVRGRGVGPQRLAHVEAGDVGQHPIEHDQANFTRPREQDGLAPRRRRDAAEPRLLEHAHEERAEIGLIVHEHDELAVSRLLHPRLLHVHRWSLGRERRSS